MKYLFLASAVLASSIAWAVDPIEAPKPITYSCPSISSSFTAGGYVVGQDNETWKITVDDIANHSTVNWAATDSAQYTATDVYGGGLNALFRGDNHFHTLSCLGNMTIAGKSYNFEVTRYYSRDLTCNKASDYTFTCHY